MFATFDGECFPAALALAGKCSLLVLENVVLSIGEYQTIDLRIEVFVLRDILVYH